MERWDRYLPRHSPFLMSANIAAAPGFRGIVVHRWCAEGSARAAHLKAKPPGSGPWPRNQICGRQYRIRSLRGWIRQLGGPAGARTGARRAARAMAAAAVLERGGGLRGCGVSRAQASSRRGAPCKIATWGFRKTDLISGVLFEK